MQIKKFDDEFKKKLAGVIADIEKVSNIELVFLVKEVSNDYTYAYLIFASILSLITFTALMFLPFVFGDYLIYSGTVLSFFLGLVISFSINPLAKIFINKLKMLKNVEIMARAYFQKGNIYHTKKHTGVLIYCSLFEKQMFIIADTGVKNYIPLEEFSQIEISLNNVFSAKYLPNEIINTLNKLKSIFSEYIPPVADDINELANNMEIMI